MQKNLRWEKYKKINYRRKQYILKILFKHNKRMNIGSIYNLYIHAFVIPFEE